MLQIEKSMPLIESLGKVKGQLSLLEPKLPIIIIANKFSFYFTACSKRHNSATKDRTMQRVIWQLPLIS